VNKEIISNKQGIILIFLYIIGEASVFVMGVEAKNDIWIAIILSIFTALPLVLIYARIHYIFLDKNIFDVIEVSFSNIIAKIIIIMLIQYTIFLVEVTLIGFSEFITIVSLKKTPQIQISMIFSFLSIWMAKKGLEVIANWAELFFLVTVIIIFMTVFLITPKMDYNNLLPILYNGTKPIIKASFSILIFPFGELLIFTMFFSKFTTRNSVYKVYCFGVLAAGIVLLIISVANILVIGVDEASVLYYPSYTTVSRINIGKVIQRLEVIVSIVLILGGILKISIGLSAVSKGVCKIFGLKDYKFILVPISLLIINLTYFDFGSTIEYHEFGKKVYPYYSIFFQVILPIIIWTNVETKKKRLIDNYR
jgi:spore germination protein KB